MARNTALPAFAGALLIGSALALAPARAGTPPADSTITRSLQQSGEIELRHAGEIPVPRPPEVVSPGPRPPRVQILSPGSYLSVLGNAAFLVTNGVGVTVGSHFRIQKQLPDRYLAWGVYGTYQLLGLTPYAFPSSPSAPGTGYTGRRERPRHIASAGAVATVYTRPGSLLSGYLGIEAGPAVVWSDTGKSWVEPSVGLHVGWLAHPLLMEAGLGVAGRSAGWLGLSIGFGGRL